MNDLFYRLMKTALQEAEKGSSEGEVPVGAVLAGPEGRIIAKAHNRPIALNDPTAHAEILVLREAGTLCENYRITGTTLVVTIEPCLMCLGAALNARISRLVFGAHDPKCGAASSFHDLVEEGRLNHKIELIPGIMEKACSKLIQDFFRVRRAKDTKSRRGTEVVVTGSTRNRLVPLRAGHVGSNPTLSANNFK
jgi:tRNA(adenine34) deaminase